MVLLLGVLFSLMLFSSCGTGPSRQDFHTVERLLTDRPDSALCLLRRMGEEAYTASPRSRSRHALLMSMALEGCGLEPSSDSLARLAFDYFSEHGTRKDRMHAANCLAGAEYACGNLTGAIVHYHDALRYAGILQDVRMEGFICQRLGELFALNYDHEEALSYARRSAACLNAVGETLSSAYSRVDEARQQLALGHISRAETLTDSLLSLPLSDPGLQYYLYLLKADLSKLKGDKALALRYYRQAGESGYSLPINSLGQYILLQESKDHTADSLLNYMRGRVRTGLDSMVYIGVLMEQACLQGDYQRAYEHLSVIDEIQDRSFISVITQSASHALKAYFEGEYKLEQARRRSQRLLSALIVIVLLIIIAAFILLLRRRRRLMEVQRVQQMAQVQELTEQLRQLAEGKMQAEATVELMLGDKMQIMDHLSKTYHFWTVEGVDRWEKKEGMAGKQKILDRIREDLKSLRSSERFIPTLEGALNKTHDNVMIRLRKDFSGMYPDRPKFSELDFQTLVLLFAGFPNQAVSFFMNLSDDAVRSRKKRYKKLFQALPPPGKELYCQLLRVPQS